MLVSLTQDDFTLALRHQLEDASLIASVDNAWLALVAHVSGDGDLRDYARGAIKAANDSVDEDALNRAYVYSMKAHGARCALVSGGFTYFTSRVREAAGFAADRANTLLDDGKTLTGAVGMPI